MDTTHAMDWAQLIILLVTILGMFFWNRSESRADIRHMDSKLEATRELVRAIYEQSKEFQAEIKDFHGRLCAIEERNRSK